MSNKNQHLVDAYLQLKQQSQSAVLATIIETIGSTYQKAGARMVIAQQDKLIGLLGGGCFERDLIEQARSVLETGQSKTLFYDMRTQEDLVWGLGLGCNGAVRILLQRLEAEQNFSPLNYFAEVAATDTAVALVTVFQSEHPEYPVGLTIHLAQSDCRLSNAVQKLAVSKSSIQPLELDGQLIEVFYQAIQPPLKLLILGAGPDAVPLLQIAKTLGWWVSVVDYRSAYLAEPSFLTADQLALVTPDNLKQQVVLDRFSAVVVMTHNLENDAGFLKALSDSQIAFIGLLGPAHRKSRLLKFLGDDAEKLAGRVFGPVGLDIGAETPEEIALSMMTGILAQLNQRDGQQLSLKAHDSCY
jgi:xanthine/CO dehydrogenase XdhC/CoxF family maturation factor